MSAVIFALAALAVAGAAILVTGPSWWRDPSDGKPIPLALRQLRGECAPTPGWVKCSRPGCSVRVRERPAGQSGLCQECKDRLASLREKRTVLEFTQPRRMP